MAKKTARAVARRKNAERTTFNDKKYGHTLFSATFEYGEGALARSSELLGLRLKNILTGVSFAALLSMILVLLIDSSMVVLIGALFVVAAALVMMTTRWNWFQLRYARSTTLAAPSTPERLHVAVTDDAVHVEGENGERGCYKLSDLRVVHSTSEFLVADFGERRYVYIPRKALSEGRYRSLLEFLREKHGR